MAHRNSHSQFDHLNHSITAIERREQVEGAVMQLRVQIAAGVLAEIMGVQYARHVEAEEKIGHVNQANGQPGWSKPLEIGLPVQIAAEAADGLLLRMGLLTAVKQDGNGQG
ncbi:MAG: hypothetical protein ACREQ5_05620 [Candidatus Dormibacteria bacterium]